jgi:hypothetical protein
MTEGQWRRSDACDSIGFREGHMRRIWRGVLKRFRREVIEQRGNREVAGLRKKTVDFKFCVPDFG